MAVFHPFLFHEVQVFLVSVPAVRTSVAVFSLPGVMDNVAKVIEAEAGWSVED